MSNTPIQVTTDLTKILERIDQKLDTVQAEVVDFRKEFTDFKTETKVAFEAVKGDINVLKAEVSAIKEDVKEVKGSSLAQIWTLIGLLGTAVVGIVIRFVITAIPGNP